MIAPNAREFLSGRLWSLWQVMETFSVHKLMGIVRGLVNTTAVADNGSEPIREGFREHIIRDFTSLLAECWSLGLPVSSKQIESVLSLLALGGSRGESNAVARAANMIASTIETELSTRLVFFVAPENARFYESDEPLFGKEFETKFPSAAFELDEVGKCLAFKRPTAAVFHLMRLAEIGINSVADCLGLPAPTKAGDRNWGNILNKVKMEMDRRNNASPKGWSRPTDQEFFAGIYVSLDAVRVAWRNATMHVENKYNDEEAEHIFIAMRGFMKKVASRLDEQGNPRA